MIHWAWVPIALFGGAFLGFLTAALCAAAGMADAQGERMQGRFRTVDELEAPSHFVDPDQINITDLAEFAESRGQGPQEDRAS